MEEKRFFTVVYCGGSLTAFGPYEEESDAHAQRSQILVNNHAVGGTENGFAIIPVSEITKIDIKGVETSVDVPVVSIGRKLRFKKSVVSRTTEPLNSYVKPFFGDKRELRQVIGSMMGDLQDKSFSGTYILHGAVVATVTDGGYGEVLIEFGHDPVETWPEKGSDPAFV